MRPVLLQETGWSEWLPEGRGLVAFRTPDEAAEKARQIEADYATHSQAAGKVAEECFAETKAIPLALRHL
jgi:hypothetical protein